MYVSSIVFFSLNASIGFQLYCHWSFVYSVVPWFVFLSMFLSVSVNACITSNIACIYPSLYPCFSLSFLSLNVYSSVRIYFHSLDSWCIFTSLDPCLCLSFSLIVYICARPYCHWLYVYRYVSYSTICLSLFPSLSQCPGYIIGNLHGNF